jgi:hypothetical protein
MLGFRGINTDEPDCFTIAQFNGIAINDPDAFEGLGIADRCK